MGNQCQNISTLQKENSVTKEINIESTNEANIECVQEFDNPKRTILSSNFLSVGSCSSNDLQSISPRSTINPSNYCSSRRYSLIKIDSIELDNEFQPTFEGYDQPHDTKFIHSDRIKQSNMFKKRDKRTSLCENLSIQEMQKLTIVKSSKDQIFSGKNFQKAIEIKSENFVSIKQMDIEKYYQFVCKIGEGTYGNVMKAICLRTNQFRAIKILKKHLQQKKDKKRNNNDPDMNLQELKVLRKLDHPNIIKLFEVYYWNESYYLVMEFCQGGSILSYLRQSRQYCQNIVKTIIKQLLTALSYLHSMKIAHRDIKLQNIVFIKKISPQSRKEDVEIKIIDFGEAFELKFSHNNKDRREIGTLTYMAPEVLEGLYSQKCDIWSCGVILWILLSGKNPFRKTSKRETIDSIRNLQLNFREQVWHQIPQNVKLMLKQMLQQSPFKRITAKQALKNNWFSETTETIDKTRMKDVLNNLYEYYRGNNLISVIESYLSFVKITAQERSEITQLFKQLDTDNSGSIDISELKQAFKFGTDEENDAELQYVLDMVDRHKSKRIDFNQFVAALYDRKKLFHEKSLQLAFDYFDNDANGYIDKKELKNVLKGCNQEQINTILKDIDENGDQKISKEEFMTYIREQRFL